MLVERRFANTSVKATAKEPQSMDHRRSKATRPSSTRSTSFMKTKVIAVRNYRTGGILRCNDG